LNWLSKLFRSKYYLYDINKKSTKLSFLNAKLKDREFILKEKQSTIENYVNYLDIARELAKIDKDHVIENVKNTRKQYESITKLMD
jgi:hypothetical protein